MRLCKKAESNPQLIGDLSPTQAYRYMNLYEKAVSNGKLIAQMTPTQAYKALGATIPRRLSFLTG
jgi:hypothetical protein